VSSVRDQRIFQGQEQAIFRVRILICKALFFMGGSIWILGLCVNKDGASSCCGPMVLADHVVAPVGRRGDI
jgi:hypothetical protein